MAAPPAALLTVVAVVVVPAPQGKTAQSAVQVAMDYRAALPG
jgi:hypothetical protein